MCDRPFVRGRHVRIFRCHGRMPDLLTTGGKLWRVLVHVRGTNMFVYMMMDGFAHMFGSIEDFVLLVGVCRVGGI